MVGRHRLLPEPEAVWRVAGRTAVAQVESEPEAVYMLVDDMQAVEEQRLR